MFIPYHADVPMRCWPVANFILIGLTTLFFFFALAAGNISEAAIGDMVLEG